MDLFIRIVDNQPFEHPILSNNFCQAFPHIDTNNLPSEFVRFQRIQPPVLGDYEVYEGLSYALVDGICKDIHHVRQMTQEEKSIQDGLLALLALKKNRSIT
jgi:hypothetical protein